MTGLKEFILQKMREIAPELVAIRREVHRHPELSFKEKRTARLIASKLRELGLTVEEGMARTGLVAVLEGSDGAKTVGLRADMDALPIAEVGDRPYRSQNRGVMHACGHDAHIACVLGAAMILDELGAELPGSVKLIFQPSEEVAPGGAKPMIAAGALEDPSVEAIFALHVDPRMEVSKIGIRSGMVMAATDTFEVTILGKGGHAAAPHLAVDAVVVAAQVIQALQQVVSRKVDPLQPVVISIGKVEGGYASNVLADRVRFWGTVRTLDSDLTRQIPQMIEGIVRGVTSSLGAEYEFRYEPGYPPLHNDPRMTELVRSSVSTLLGEQSAIEITQPSMGGEDFAYFLEKVPGCLLYLGVRNEGKGITNFWHHPGFDIDEGALPVGAGVLAQVAIDFLRRA